jgi:hypothetical protein
MALLLGSDLLSKGLFKTSFGHSKNRFFKVYMATLIKEKKKGLTDETPGQLQNFIGEVKKGKITPAQEK